MTIKSFRQEVIDNIREYLSQEWQDAEIIPHDYLKANIKVCGLSFKKHAEGALEASPSLNMEDWYERYLDDYSMDEILSEMAGVVEHSAIVAPDVDILNHLNEMTDRIVYELIHTEQNQEYLKGLPHREFQDLSIIYSWYCEFSAGNAHIRITNELADAMKLSEEQLYEFAKENTKTILPYTIENLGDVASRLMAKGGVEMEATEMDNAINFYVVTNSESCYGAVAMLEETVQDKLYEIFEEDFYLIPSSRHEVLAIPKSAIPVERLGEIVSEVNAGSVELCDRLSNNVYQYDSMTKEITIAYDAPNKRLDYYEDAPAQERVPVQASR